MTTHLGRLSASGEHLADRFWPGPLTLILPAPRGLARDVTGGLGTIGVRVPDHGVARAICAACDRPVTATSANISGEPASSDPDEIERVVRRVFRDCPSKA